MNNEQFTLRFSGVAELKPQALRAKELATILENMEAAVAASVVERDPTLKQNQVMVALVGVSDQSVGLTFTPNLQELTFPALAEIAQAISSNQIGKLAGSVVKALEPIVQFVRARGCTAELSFTRGGVVTTAVITPATRIERAKPLKSVDILYGNVMRVGGVEPKVEIKTIDGTTLYCETTEQIALKLAKRLYTQVAVEGMATWDPQSFEIKEFQVTELLPYAPVELPEAFRQLRESTKGFFETIGDVEEYIHELRYAEE